MGITNTSPIQQRITGGAAGGGKKNSRNNGVEKKVDPLTKAFQTIQAESMAAAKEAAEAHQEKLIAAVRKNMADPEIITTQVIDKDELKAEAKVRARQWKIPNRSQALKNIERRRALKGILPPEDKYKTELAIVLPADQARIAATMQMIQNKKKEDKELDKYINKVLKNAEYQRQRQAREAEAKRESETGINIESIKAKTRDKILKSRNTAAKAIVKSRQNSHETKDLAVQRSQEAAAKNQTNIESIKRKMKSKIQISRTESRRSAQESKEAASTYAEQAKSSARDFADHLVGIQENSKDTRRIILPTHLRKTKAKIKPESTKDAA